VRSAIQQKKFAADRQQSIVAGDASLRVINFAGTSHRMFVGELIEYTVGKEIPLAEIKAGKAAFDLSTSKAKAGSELLESTLYFAISEDHLVISQTSSLRASALESHLNWFLHETGLIPDDAFIFIADTIPASVVNDVRSSKAVELSSNIKFETTGENGEKIIVEKPNPVSAKLGTTTDTKSILFTPFGNAWDALQKLIPELDLQDQLSPDELASGRELKVKLLLSWKRAGRDQPSQMLDQIANQLRHVETEAEYAIVTKNGTRITQKEIKQSHPVSVKMKNGLVVRDDLWPKMNDWLQRLISEVLSVSQ
tara:strand:+ start:27 stop:956 length:930 start_codon:yes stop_codon:yes gene_type:complete